MNRCRHRLVFAAGCWWVAAVVAGGSGVAAEPDGPGSSVRATVTVELIDSVRSWCSPLWGHNAPKIVAGKNGEFWVALFSGDYPEARVEILKRSPQGRWERGKAFTGAYQPSLLFVDSEGRLNILQNSQTEPLIHMRSADDISLGAFDTVAQGNGQQDGRGWYVGAGIHNDTVFMSYITLSYDLFLTWKPLRAPSWAEPVLLHGGSVDTVKGNHSWTRSRIQFHSSRGYLVANETSDGSVKNSYNAVQLVTFDLADPRRFSTECVDRVPQGFGAYSSDFLVTSDGWLHVFVERSARLYDTPWTSDGEPGVFVASRPVSGGPWSNRRVFDGLSDGSLAVDESGRVTAVRVSAPSEHARGSWQVSRSDGHGDSWRLTDVAASPMSLRNPSHIQVVTAANSWRPVVPAGLFEDAWGKNPGDKTSRYGVYFFQLTTADTESKGPGNP